MQDYWNMYVKSRDDVVNFYKLYYPCLPDCLVLALAEKIEKTVKGETTIEDSWLVNKSKPGDDFESEVKRVIEEERLKGIEELKKKKAAEDQA